MKIEEYLHSLPTGSVITNKRVLSVLKRKGLIYNYSQWGYLESCWADFTEEDGYRRHEISYVPVPENMTQEDWYKSNCGRCEFEYKGVKFGTKYLSGCFNAYLTKEGGIDTSGKTANPRMSLYGSIL